jgi:signal transduction histidine kinase
MSRVDGAFAPGHAPLFEEAFKRAIERGEPYDLELEFIRPNGEHIWVRSMGRPVLENGKVLRVTGNIMDVTDRKKAEAERATLDAQLRQAQKMEAIGRLAGGIAHDFNNILSAIVGYGELARLDLPNDSRASRFLVEVLNASERAKELIKQILSITRQTEEQLKPILVTPVIKEVLKLLRASIPSTIEIRQSIAANDTVIHADPTRIHQIVMNLCTNAYQAMMEDGGVLSVSTEEVNLQEKTEELAPGLPPGRYFVLTVSDTGQGIHPDILDKIFDPYFTTKQKDEGTGLGLAVVRSIVERLAGRVQVSSRPGVGATIRVILPSDRTHIEEHEGQECPFERGSERILFVDDEPTLMVLGKGLFESLGYQVEAVSNGAEAFERFSGTPDKFDLVITDLTMPGMTGSKLAERIL